MAISDLSVFISADKEVQLSKKDGSKGSAATESASNQNGDFLSQLQTAHNAVETPAKEPKSDIEAASNESVVAQSKAEPTIDIDSEEDATNSGDAMLAQITAANNMDTSVKSPLATHSVRTTQFGSYQEEIDENKLVDIKTPRPIDKVTPIIDMPFDADESVDKQLKPTLQTEKSVIAEAIDKQLQFNGNAAGDDVQLVKDIPLTSKESLKDAVQATKDMPLPSKEMSLTTKDMPHAIKDTPMAQQAQTLQSVLPASSASVAEADTDGEKTQASYESKVAIQSTATKQNNGELPADATVIKTALTTAETINTKSQQTVNTEHLSNVSSAMSTSEQSTDQLTATNSAALDQTTKLLLSEKSTVQKNADPLLSNLTPAQRQQLQIQVATIQEQGVSAVKVASLKQTLAEFVTLNSTAATQPAALAQTAPTEITELTQLGKELSLLSSEQKQLLSQKLQEFVATEQPKGTLLAKINTVIDELAQMNTVAKPNQAQSQSVQSVISGVADTNSTVVPTSSDKLMTTQSSQATATKASTFSGVQFDNKQQIGQTNVGSEVQLVKQGVSKSEPKIDPLAEHLKLEQNQLRESSITRVNQLFGQITGLTTALTATAAYDGSEQSYQQALADMQVMHAQQTSPTSATKQVNLDPTVLQALNIVKSDAAKLLQERVSALLSINNKEAEIRLDPPEMGSMQIRIRSDAEQAHINFVVQNQQAKEALEQSLPRLRELLAQQGIELGESNIQQGHGQAQQGGDGQHNGQGQLANQQQNEQQDSATQQSTVATGQQSSSSIDYYA
ncbi:flagellar hook-length control protein FliK [Pseudoalteromonas sp. KAN5]|uniref:flagellar hook-length control protein FliK n=1 Tax=Pseudoalteromonas sp. KAN5 TaxID=2916633 RepID=UPI001FCB1062|nr:flagellar hook-length control protein FliK [Pseudoalteromonas sp. KAN5]BDF95012.1 hypothetical protein KAN5_18500 [Pseudoalteromonas sp. KAN5]